MNKADASIAVIWMNSGMMTSHVWNSLIIRSYKCKSSLIVKSGSLKLNRMGRWQSGQLHQTVNLTPHGYIGSNPILPKLFVPFLWALSLVGRAPALHAGGQGFDSPRVQFFWALVVQWIEQQPSKLWIRVRSPARVRVV